MDTIGSNGGEIDPSTSSGIQVGKDEPIVFCDMQHGMQRTDGFFGDDQISLPGVAPKFGIRLADKQTFPDDSSLPALIHWNKPCQNGRFRANRLPGMGGF